MRYVTSGILPGRSIETNVLYLRPELKVQDRNFENTCSAENGGELIPDFGIDLPNSKYPGRFWEFRLRNGRQTDAKENSSLSSELEVHGPLTFILYPEL